MLRIWFWKIHGNKLGFLFLFCFVFPLVHHDNISPNKCSWGLRCMNYLGPGEVAVGNGTAGALKKPDFGALQSVIDIYCPASSSALFLFK